MRKNAKSILAGLFIAGLSITANAQVQQPVVPASGTGFYVGVHGGYNLPIAKQNFGFGEDTFQNYTYQDGPDKIDDIMLSLGKGANFGVNLGYMFTPHVGAELAVDYFLGSKTTAKMKWTNYPNDVYDQKVSAKSIQLKPTVVIRGKQAQVTPYAKIGAVIGLGNKITYSYEYYEEPNYTENKEWELKEGVSAGFTGSLGVDFAINNQVSIFGEITGIAMNYAPKKASMISYTENGVSYINDFYTNEREITFEDEYTPSNDPNQPTKTSRISTPFSSIGLNVGVKFHF